MTSPSPCGSNNQICRAGRLRGAGAETGSGRRPPWQGSSHLQHESCAPGAALAGAAARRGQDQQCEAAGELFLLAQRKSTRLFQAKNPTAQFWVESGTKQNSSKPFGAFVWFFSISFWDLSTRFATFCLGTMCCVVITLERFMSSFDFLFIFFTTI